MTIGPIHAAMDAIAAYYDAKGITALSSFRGWPEYQKDLDLINISALSIIPGARAEIEQIQPTEVCRVDGTPPDVLITYRVAWLKIHAQMDLWCSHRSKRDDLSALVLDGFPNTLPQANHLELLSTGYHGRPLTVTMRELGPLDDPDKVTRGEWRQTWDLDIETDLVVDSTHPKLLKASIIITVTDQGITIQEAQFDITP